MGGGVYWACDPAVAVTLFASTPSLDLFDLPHPDPSQATWNQELECGWERLFLYLQAREAP